MLTLCRDFCRSSRAKTVIVLLWLSAFCTLSFAAQTTDDAALSAQGNPASCSNATLSGNYGLFLAGSDSSGNVLVSSGQITVNGKGGFSGTWNQAISGKFVDGIPLTGTYKVNANCTGLATLTPHGASAMHLSIVLASAGAQFDMIDTDSGNTQSGYAQAQGNAVCSGAGISGKWAFVQTNAFVVGVGLGAYAAQVKFATNGTVTLNGTYSVNGDVQKLKASGTYAIGSNCTGTLNFGGEISHIVVVNGGHGMLILSENPLTVGETIGRK
jgi:hypothetical protein